MDALSVALQVAFYAIFAGTLWRCLQRPGPLEIAVAAVFGSAAAVFVNSLLNQLAPGVFTFLQPVAIVALLAQPVLIFWLVHQIRPLARWVLPLVLVVLAVAALGLLVPAQRVPLLVLFAGLYFIGAEAGAAALLLNESRRRYGLARLRLGLAGLGTLLFGAAIFIASVASAAAAPGTGSDPAASFIARLAALLAGLSYMAAFIPPRWLRHLGQRAVAFELTHTVIASGEDPSVLWRNLAHAARDILGAQKATVTDLAGSELAATAESPLPGPRPAPRAMVEIPIVAGRQQTHWLQGVIDGRPLFVDDDVSVIGLLGSLTARAVERQEAVLRLAEARHQLEAAQAVKVSEARFRALLAAEPNAILAVDEKGVITWATGMAGELFGRSAEELAGQPLDELIRIEATSLADLGSAATVRRGHASARRADGAHFPADLAWTSFELEGEQIRLVVVSDASWRQEANLIRDRFLGVLSHELRTPITSIYGGTQLLVKRGERIADEERRELLDNVAAESERLHRIIENLLILARVERGADFFERRPVALKPLLTDLVARERGFWPQMAIELKLRNGVPLVAGDEEYLTLIMRNLLSNAAKYAGPGPRVDVVVEHADAEVRVMVRDNGPGLADGEAEQLFSLYYRSAASSSTPGAGIGLFVCRGLVTAMGGRIWAASRPEGGAEFGFSLPVYEEPEQEPAAGESPEAAIHG